MTTFNFLQAGVFIALVALLVTPVGTFLERVFDRQPTFLDPLLRPIERLIHRLIGIDPEQEMGWRRYSLAFVTFGVVNIVVLFLALRAQASLPWFFPKLMNTAITPHLAANTAV